MTSKTGVAGAKGGFWRNIKGGTAMMVGLALPVIALVIGGAVDFSRMMQLRMQMQDAADLASVGSIAVNSAAFKQGLFAGNGNILKIGQTDARAMFTNNMQSHTDLSNLKVVAKVVKTKTGLQSTVTATGNYTPYILDLIGFKALPLEVTSTSQANFPPYIDFYLLLDNSPSMGLGATTTDINNLVTATKAKSSDANCAFACHETDKPATGSNMDYYHLAKSIGVTMRIDVVRQATQNLMTTATNTETLPNQYRMAIYDLGADATTISATAPGATVISALTSNLTTSASNAAAIDLMTVPYQNYNNDEQTNYTSVLADMNTRIPAAGSGLTAASPQEVLFMVADGVNDGYYNGGRRIAAIDTTTCTALKARGVRIAVLYTTYLMLTPGQNSFFDSNVKPLLTPTDKVAAGMQTCASPGLYFAVSPSEGISDAMAALFKKIVSVVRINS